MKLPVWLNRNIFSLGLVSMLNDVGSEIVTALLPAFLISLGGTPALLGFIEGSAEVVVSIMKLISGWFSDKWSIRKPFAAFGYAATAAGNALLSTAPSWKRVFVGRSLSRLGKGLREPARDAMLVESSTPTFYTYIFGFHRMMDTLGAIIGPLFALALVSFFSMRIVIALGTIPCIAAVLIMIFMVQDTAKQLPAASNGAHFFKSIFELPRHFYIFLTAVGLFSLGNCTVSLFILRATHMTSTSSAHITTFMAVALYSIFNVSYAFFCLLIGYAADHIGIKNVLLIGYLLTTGVLAGFMVDGLNGILGNAALFIFAGLAQACVDTVQKSMAGNLIPEHMHATGYGALAMVIGIGIFCANTGVGLLWTFFSPALGFACAALMTLLGAGLLYGFKNEV